MSTLARPGEGGGGRGEGGGGCDPGVLDSNRNFSACNLRMTPEVANLITVTVEDGTEGMSPYCMYLRHTHAHPEGVQLETGWTAVSLLSPSLKWR